MTDFQVNIYHDKNVTTEYITAEWYQREGNIYTFYVTVKDTHESKVVVRIHLSNEHTVVIRG